MMPDAVVFNADFDFCIVFDLWVMYRGGWKFYDVL